MNNFLIILRVDGIKWPCFEGWVVGWRVAERVRKFPLLEVLRRLNSRGPHSRQAANTENGIAITPSKASMFTPNSNSRWNSTRGVTAKVMDIVSGVPGIMDQNTDEPTSQKVGSFRTFYCELTAELRHAEFCPSQG